MSEQHHAAAAKGQIELLLEEYRALRSEIDQRIATRATFIGFLTAGAAFIVGPRKGLAIWIAAGVFIVILVIVWAASTSMLNRLGKRIRELEEQLNILARTAYGLSDTPKLLNWETSFIASPGWMRKTFKWTRIDRP